MSTKRYQTQYKNGLSRTVDDQRVVEIACVLTGSLVERHRAHSHMGDQRQVFEYIFHAVTVRVRLVLLLRHKQIHQVRSQISLSIHTLLIVVKMEAAGSGSHLPSGVRVADRRAMEEKKQWLSPLTESNRLSQPRL